MAFKFRLQKLLDYREGQKLLAREELARRQRELTAIEKEMEKLRQEEQRLLQLHRGQQVQKIDISALMTVESYRAFLQERYRCKLQEFQQGREEVEEQQQVVVQSWKKCQVLNRLKERDLCKYSREEKLQEQRFYDELSLCAYAREKGEQTGRG